MNAITSSYTFRKRLFIFGLLFLAGIIVTSIVNWYFRLYSSPQSILLRSLLNVEHVHATNYFGTLKLAYGKVSEDAIFQKPREFSSGFTGSYVSHDIEKTPRVSFSGAIYSNDVLIADFDLRSINGVIYLYIKNLFEIGLIDKEKVINQWIAAGATILPSSIKRMIIFPFWQFDKQKLFSLAREGVPIRIIEVLPDDQIEGVATYHFRYQIDNQQMKHLFTEPEFDSSLLTFGEGEIWIGKENEYIHAFTYTIHKKSTEENAPEITISGNISFTDVNSPISLEIPPNAISLEKILPSAVKGIAIP